MTKAFQSVLLSSTLCRQRQITNVNKKKNNKTYYMHIFVAPKYDKIAIANVFFNTILILAFVWLPYLAFVSLYLISADTNNPIVARGK